MGSSWMGDHTIHPNFLVVSILMDNVLLPGGYRSVNRLITKSLNRASGLYWEKKGIRDLSFNKSSSTLPPLFSAVQQTSAASMLAAEGMLLQATADTLVDQSEST